METIFNMNKDTKDQLRAYFRRFQSKLLHIEGCDEKIVAIKFKMGLPHTNKLHQSLTKILAEDMMSLLAKAEKYTKLEDKTPPQGIMVMDAPPDLRSRLSPTKE